jgi:hypothetical protein
MIPITPLTWKCILLSILARQEDNKKKSITFLKIVKTTYNTFCNLGFSQLIVSTFYLKTRGQKKNRMKK